MGIYLSSPDTKKHSLDGDGNGMKYGTSAMQGWRQQMEDAHINEPVFTLKTSLFAVFDGHGGPEVAKFCEQHFGAELKKNINFQNGHMEEALKQTFMKMDELLLEPEGIAEISSLKRSREKQQQDQRANQKDPKDQKDQQQQQQPETTPGCTSNVVLIYNNIIYCANSGDSRCICYSKKKVIELSVDHKPDDPIEKERIEKAGGYIQEGRVNGTLNLSRAIGDLEYKKNAELKPEEQLIIAQPDVVKRVINPDDKFLVLGCDGIWEIMTHDEICWIVDSKIRRNNCKLSEIVEEILERGLAPDTSQGIGCDNMSAMIVQLREY